MLIDIHAFSYDNAEESEPPVDVTNEALVDLTTSQLSLDAVSVLVPDSCFLVNRAEY